MKDYCCSDPSHEDVSNYLRDRVSVSTEIIDHRSFGHIERHLINGMSVTPPRYTGLYWDVTFIFGDTRFHFIHSVCNLLCLPHNPLFWLKGIVQIYDQAECVSLELLNLTDKIGQGEILPAEIAARGYARLLKESRAKVHPENYFGGIYDFSMTKQPDKDFRQIQGRSLPAVYVASIASRLFRTSMT